MGRDQFQGVSEQAKAGKHRLEDALVLIAQGRWRGAMYLAGYSVEWLLKVKLMKQFGCYKLRDLEEVLSSRGMIGSRSSLFSHELEVLLRLCGGLERMRSDRETWQAFGRVNRWVPAWRYSADPSSSQVVEDFLKSIQTVCWWIEHNV